VRRAAATLGIIAALTIAPATAVAAQDDVGAPPTTVVDPNAVTTPATPVAADDDDDDESDKTGLWGLLGLLGLAGLAGRKRPEETRVVTSGATRVDR
jgi:MYXO-CTERM domain-containing protein